MQQEAPYSKVQQVKALLDKHFQGANRLCRVSLLLRPRNFQTTRRFSERFCDIRRTMYFKARMAALIKQAEGAEKYRVDWSEVKTDFNQLLKLANPKI